MKYEFYKKGRRVVCYIAISDKAARVCTGKPSDAVCLSWRYSLNELDKARATAREYFENYTRI